MKTKNQRFEYRRQRVKREREFFESPGFRAPEGGRREERIALLPGGPPPALVPRQVPKHREQQVPHRVLLEPVGVQVEDFQEAFLDEVLRQDRIAHLGMRKKEEARGMAVVQHAECGTVTLSESTQEPPVGGPAFGPRGGQHTGVDG